MGPMQTEAWEAQMREGADDDDWKIEHAQAVCPHAHKQATKHFTYGMYWRCADCGKRGEDWWD